MIFAKLNLKKRWELTTVKESHSRKDKNQNGVSYRKEVGINDCVCSWNVVLDQEH